MTDENRPSEQPAEIPEDAIVVRQASYAWLWSSTPWLIGIYVLFQLGVLVEPFIAVALMLVIVVPRFLVWRGTAYILTDKELIYQRGGIMGSRKYRIPFTTGENRMVDVQSRYGMFGRGLGYQAVDILLDNQDNARFQRIVEYVPTSMGMEGLLRQRMGSDRQEPPDLQETDNGPDQLPSNDSNAPPDSDTPSQVS